MKIRILCYLLVVVGAFYLGWVGHSELIEPEVDIRWVPEYRTVEKAVETVVYRYPLTPPYEEIPDPINYEQALVLLGGMRASHEQLLHWTFEADPGFGIGDKDLQRLYVKMYDQLIEYVQRQELKK